MEEMNIKGRRRRALKKKEGLYIEVSEKVKEIQEERRPILVHCNDEFQVRQRLAMYGGRARLKGYWNGQEFEDYKLK